MLVKLANTHTDIFGRAIYAEFLKRRITGMPEINGRPAEEFDITRNPSRLADRLPKNYGAEFGEKCFRTLMGKFRNPQLVDNILDSFYERFLMSGASHLHEGAHLHQVESYVISGLINQGLNMIKSRSREISDHDDEGDSYDFTDVEDPHALEQFERDPLKHIDIEDVLHKLPQLSSQLRRIHPDAEEFIRLLLEGHSKLDIVGDYRKNRPSMLPHVKENPMTYQNWNSNIEPKIYKVIQQAFIN